MKIDYQTMTDKELRSYMLEHREDNDAFYAYIERSRANGRLITIDPSAPDWEDKAVREIEKRINSFSVTSDQ